VRGTDFGLAAETPEVPTPRPDRFTKGSPLFVVKNGARRDRVACTLDLWIAGTAARGLDGGLRAMRGGLPSVSGRGGPSADQDLQCDAIMVCLLPSVADYS
jgi:hypothetical protein